MADVDSIINELAEKRFTERVLRILDSSFTDKTVTVSGEYAVPGELMSALHEHVTDAAHKYVIGKRAEIDALVKQRLDECELVVNVSVMLRDPKRGY